MKKIKIGILFGLAAGVIDIIPMLIDHLTWDANISALSMWIVVGIFIATVEWHINAIVKGILISLLVLLPSAILIGWKEPISLFPIFSITIILGGLIGYLINRTINGTISKTFE